MIVGVLHGDNAAWNVEVRPHAGAMANGCEPLLMLREIIDLGGVCLGCDTGDIPSLDALDPGAGYLAWRFAMPATATEAMVRDAFDYVGDDCSLVFGDDAPLQPVRVPQVPAVPPVAVPAPPSIRIDLAKLDTLIDAVGELVIAQAMMAQRLASLGAGTHRAVIDELALMEALTRDIQHIAMAIRAQPIGAVFSRVPRILRELADSTGKCVHLVVSGESTELDKTVIERLGEPLTHLIRNAVGHGIEPAETRIAMESRRLAR